MEWVKDTERSTTFDTGSRIVSKTEWKSADGRFRTEKTYCQNPGGQLHSAISVKCWNLYDALLDKWHRGYVTFAALKAKARRIASS